MDKTTKMRDQTVCILHILALASYSEAESMMRVWHTNNGEIVHGSVGIELLSQVRDQQQGQEDGDTHMRQSFGGAIVDEVELGSQDTDPDGYQYRYGGLNGPQEGDQNIRRRHAPFLGAESSSSRCYFGLIPDVAVVVDRTTQAICGWLCEGWEGDGGADVFVLYAVEIMVIGEGPNVLRNRRSGRITSHPGTRPMCVPPLTFGNLDDCRACCSFPSNDNAKGAFFPKDFSAVGFCLFLSLFMAQNVFIFFGSWRPPTTIRTTASPGAQTQDRHTTPRIAS